jgi:hypothetical protein
MFSFDRRLAFRTMAVAAVLGACTGLWLVVGANAAPCPYDKCFYKQCTRDSANYYRYFGQCPNAETPAHSGESTQNLGELETPNPPNYVKYWTVDLESGTDTCESRYYPHEADCPEQAGPNDGTIACSKCKDAS